MIDIKAEPTDAELADVDDKLMSRGWINLLDAAGLCFRERQVIGWALRMAPRFRARLIEQATADTSTLDGDK